MTNIRSSNVVKVGGTCSRRRSSEWQRHVNGDQDSIVGSGEEAKVMGNVTHVSRLHRHEVDRHSECQAWQCFSGVSTAWLVFWTMARMSSDISTFRTSSLWCYQSRVVIMAHRRCCGTVFEGRYKSNLLRESNESIEHLDLVTSIGPEGSRRAGGRRSMNCMLK